MPARALVGSRLAIILAALAAASPAAAQGVAQYLQQPDGTVLVVPPYGPSYTVTPLPGGDGYFTAPPPAGSTTIIIEPKGESYWQRYRRGGSAGCVAGCSDQ